jgi:transposase InsO family protein
MHSFYERLIPNTPVIFNDREYYVDAKKDDYLILIHAQTLTPQIEFRRTIEKAKENKTFLIKNMYGSRLHSSLSQSQRDKIALDEKIAAAIVNSTTPFTRVNVGGSSLFYAQIIARKVLDDEGYNNIPTPSKSALHRLVARYRKNDGDLSISLSKPKKRGKQLSAEIERLIRVVIDVHYLTLNKPSVSSTYRVLQKTCPASLRNQLPDESTLRRRIYDLKEVDVIKGREGEDAFRNYIRSSKAKIKVDRLLQRVELDAMHVILGLVDEEGVFIGYFTLYLAIDTASRRIVGYHIEPKLKLRGETPSGVLGSINSILSDNVIFPKDYDSPPVSGIPELFVMDHGTAYQCREVFKRLKYLGIEFENTGTKRGSGKGIIERFIRTLRLMFFREIKGYRDSRLAQKHVPSGQPKHENCVKLSELRIALEHFIYEEYANRPHEGIEYATPKQEWDRIYRTTPTLPADEIDIEHIRVEETSLTPHLQNGIRFRNQSFKSNELRQLCIDHGKVKTGGKIGKVTVFYNEFDASTISVLDESTGELIDAKNDDPAVLPHISFIEVNAKREYNKTVSKTRDKLASNVDSSRGLTKNKIKKGTRKRPHERILEDKNGVKVTTEDMLGESNGFIEPKNYDEQSAYDENADAYDWG